MKNQLTKVVALAAMLALSACADDIPPPPDEFGRHGSAGAVALLCLLPLAGAGCLYFALRRRK